VHFDIGKSFKSSLNFSKMIRRVLASSGPLMGAAVIAKAEEPKKKEQSLICKPSNLPIYASLVDRWLCRLRRRLQDTYSLDFLSLVELSNVSMPAKASHQSSQ
jgi:hypothetical protein